MFRLTASLVVVAAAALGEAGWQQSYTAGYRDASGNYLGGSELIHLEAHGGKLYAAIGYWEDTRNCIYANSCWNTTTWSQGWAQILRLDESGGEWQLDLDMSTGYLRAESLRSMTFTTDRNGEALAKPVTKLVAAAYKTWMLDSEVTVFVRDDETGAWENTTLMPGSAGSVRSVELHRDAVTGVDHAFMSVGTNGVFSGAWESGTIVWNTSSESGEVAVRPLSMTEANGQLFFTSGQYIYARQDGAQATWDIAFDMGGGTPRKAIGGIRGLTAVENPNGEGESLLFIWTNSSTNHGCMYRLDPDGNGGYSKHLEVCLADLMTDYLGGTPVYYTLGAYNKALPIRDPSDGSAAHLIGFEARIECSTHACVETDSSGQGSNAGYYAGGVFFIRRGPSDYRLNEIGGPHHPGAPALVAVRTYAVSPFGNASGAAVYFGGYDCNTVLAPTDTAWAFRGELTTVLTPLLSTQRMLVVAV
eukprot:NODE_5550_length_1758_cov_4.333538.p1 GENE.NODE_5550_length_1758_cov_4.333538~~NODE_5550_length_1758_cov_4.333538.p1  ORF type:complete len:474 (+),score=91.43 NODE_5550_length_1758_cov_4.333538:38-1459(+)